MSRDHVLESLGLGKEYEYENSKYFVFKIVLLWKQKKNYSKEYRVILLFKNILLICDWACTQIIMRDVCTNVCTLIS